MSAVYTHAEEIAVWLVELSTSMIYTIVCAEGVLCLLMGAVACEIWHSAHWRSPPFQSDRRDWVTYVTVRSFSGCVILTTAFVACGLLWVGWLFVEYVAWTSPTVEAAFREAEAQHRTFSSVGRRDIRGRMVSFITVPFGIGCSGWALYWLWKARMRLRDMSPEGTGRR
jgi:hypothetical protein